MEPGPDVTTVAEFRAQFRGHPVIVQFTDSGD